MTVNQLISAALAEDLGAGDITSRLTIPADHRSRGRIVARCAGRLAGIDVCRKVFRAVDRTLVFRARLGDGARLGPGSLVAEVSGRTRSILAAERTALNFLNRLSGIATLTARYVAAVKGTRAAILDTRKTVPGWRELDKLAVRCGGGRNHRFRLDDMILVKDNHVRAAGSVAAALARCQGARRPVEVEVGNLSELRQALAAGARRIMLDNMTPAAMRRAVAVTAGQAKLEASGRMTLARAGRAARAGVDFVSVGALTHSAPALDIGLDLISRKKR